MPIPVTCPKCGLAFRVKEGSRAGNCPRCFVAVRLDGGSDMPTVEEAIQDRPTIAPAVPTMPSGEDKQPSPSRPIITTGNVTIGSILSLVLIGFWLWYWFGGGVEKHVQVEQRRIEVQVAKDLEAQYEIAKRSGSATDAYLHAGAVAEAYLQAKDEGNYRKWKQIAAEEARRAGVPLP